MRILSYVCHPTQIYCHALMDAIGACPLGMAAAAESNLTVGIGEHLQDTGHVLCCVWLDDATRLHCDVGRPIRSLAVYVGVGNR